LRNADSQSVVDYISTLKKQAEDIEKGVLELAIYSEGAISYRDAWEMSFPERNIAIKIINERNLRKAGKDPNQYL
jgi:hypothetical protein